MSLFGSKQVDNAIGDGLAIPGNPSVMYRDASTLTGSGASSPLFGGGAIGVSVTGPLTGNAGGTNTGAGGSGSSSGAGHGSIGGASGGCFDVIIDAPAATYTYTIGTGGAGGIGTGTNPATGGAGAAGVVIVEEHYNY
jgi:hypothetical protein